MEVYIVLDDSKACYDAGDVFHSVHSTLEEAEEEVKKYGSGDKWRFDIEEHTI